jgi:hypothetical protein
MHHHKGVEGVGRLTFEITLLIYKHGFFFVETMTREQTQHAQTLDWKLAAFECSSDHLDAIGRVRYGVSHDDARGANGVRHNAQVPGLTVRKVASELEKSTYALNN